GGEEDLMAAEPEAGFEADAEIGDVLADLAEDGAVVADGAGAAVEHPEPVVPFEAQSMALGVAEPGSEELPGGVQLIGAAQALRQALQLVAAVQAEELGSRDVELLEALDVGVAGPLRGLSVQEAAGVQAA